MRKIILTLLGLGTFLIVNAQPKPLPIDIKQMKWGLDYQIYLKLNNDSSYSLPIENLFHVLPKDNQFQKPEFTYFPVRFDSAYIEKLRERYPTEQDFSFDLTITEKDPKTLWSSLSSSLEGGWVHFVNCMVYSLETQELDLRSTIMTRPVSDWKPKPMTETYKRTVGWKYYLPMTMKEAQKEYKLRKKEGRLEDLASVPPQWIDIFLHTNDRMYELDRQAHDFRRVAKVDAIKILLGAKYLSTPQLNYMKSCVLKAVTNYKLRQMPTVLIFDEYEAAISLSLDETGYTMENIIFKNEEDLTEEEISQRKAIINDYITLINLENKYQFQKRLKSTYINPPQPKDEKK
jgi:hypothetical protein